VELGVIACNQLHNTKELGTGYRSEGISCSIQNEEAGSGVVVIGYSIHSAVISCTIQSICAYSYFKVREVGHG
jgi:hypothetical protein